MRQDDKGIFDALIAEDNFGKGKECTCAYILDCGARLAALEANRVEPCEEVVVGKLKHFLVHQTVGSLDDAQYNIIFFRLALEEKYDVDGGVDDGAHFLVPLQKGLLGFYSFQQFDKPDDLDKDGQNGALNSL